MNDLPCCGQGWISQGGCEFRVFRAAPFEDHPQIKNEIAWCLRFGILHLYRTQGRAAGAVIAWSRIRP